MKDLMDVLINIFKIKKFIFIISLLLFSALAAVCAYSAEGVELVETTMETVTETTTEESTETTTETVIETTSEATTEFMTETVSETVTESISETSTNTAYDDSSESTTDEGAGLPEDVSSEESTESTTERETETTTERTTAETEQTTDKTTQTTETSTETTTQTTVEVVTKHHSGGGGGGGGSGGTGGGVFNSSFKKLADKQTTETESETEAATQAPAAENGGKSESAGEQLMKRRKLSYFIDSPLAYLDKIPINIVYSPYIQKHSSSALISVRSLQAGLGSDVDISWQAKSKTAAVKYGGHTVKITAGSSYLTADGRRVYFKHGAYAEIKDGRIYLPFRALGEALGFKVDWDGEKRMAVYYIPE